MNKISPICSSTISSTDPHVWIPNSFDNFLEELEHITSSYTGDDPCPLYRGHADSNWLLESTFARTCKKNILDLLPHEKPYPYVRESTDYHRVVVNLLMLKYGVLIRPPDEDDQEIDYWFDLMKLYQQYPGKDHNFLKGTFFLDWSLSQKVALFFANLNRQRDGSLWIFDSVASGNILHRQVGAILDLMNERCNGPNPVAPGIPLIFYPDKPKYYEQAENQKARYVAQMDLRYDLEDIWKTQESNMNGELIYVKLILPNGTQSVCNQYLMEKGITKTWLFPQM